MPEQGVIVATYAPALRRFAALYEKGDHGYAACMGVTRQVNQEQRRHA